VGLCVSLAISGACYAKSDLQVFLDEVPKQLKFIFAKANSCSLSLEVDEKAAGTPLDRAERKISENCYRELRKDASFEVSTGFSRDEATSLISRYEALSQSERRLTYYGKPVPGYEASEYTTKLLGCTDHRAANELTACFVKVSRTLAETSTEVPETIAAATEAACDAAEVAMRRQLLSCMQPSSAKGIVDDLVARLRRDAVATVVIRRAAKQSPNR